MNVERGMLPPSAAIEIEAIATAVARWETARDEAKSADRALLALERGSGRLAAEREDARELAAAISADRPAPAPHHVAEHDTAVEAARLQAQARVIVEQEAWSGVVSAFAAHGDELTAKAAKDFETARKAFLRALAGLQAAHSKLTTAEAVRNFASDAGVGYRPGSFFDVGWVELPPVDPDSGRTRADAVLTALEMVGAGKPLHPPGVNPDALRNEHGHLAPWQQGRIGTVVPPGGPAAGPARQRVPG